MICVVTLEDFLEEGKAINTQQNKACTLSTQENFNILLSVSSDWIWDVCLGHLRLCHLPYTAAAGQPWFIAQSSSQSESKITEIHAVRSKKLSPRDSPCLTLVC